MQKDERIVYLTLGNSEIQQYFNVPERNTALLLLGKGSSITDSAARKLAESNVMVGFCGSGGSPLLSTVDFAFLTPHSEYGPTEYMQSWGKKWFDEPSRLRMARELVASGLIYAVSFGGKTTYWRKNKSPYQRTSQSLLLHAACQPITHRKF